MNVTIVDYQSGNISSVINSFTEVAKGKVNLEVTSDIKKIKTSDKIVLPGQGSFKSCVDSLNSINGLVETLKEFAITNKKPLLGICVGLQMFADVGYEEAETKGLGWIAGKVSKIDNLNGKFKLPQLFQLQQIIHQRLFVRLRRKICLEHNFILRKVIKSD
jgi:glutamine amidotransferase